MNTAHIVAPTTGKKCIYDTTELFEGLIKRPGDGSLSREHVIESIHYTIGPYTFPLHHYWSVHQTSTSQLIDLGRVEYTVSSFVNRTSHVSSIH